MMDAPLARAGLTFTFVVYDVFVYAMKSNLPPPAARIDSIDMYPLLRDACTQLHSAARGAMTARSTNQHLTLRRAMMAPIALLESQRGCQHEHTARRPGRGPARRGGKHALSS